MSRYRTYGRNDEAAIADGDAAFVGVDEREPSQVAPGYAHSAKNYFFRNREAMPRGGCVALGWMNGAGLTWPIDFPIDWEYPKPIFTKVLAAAVFNDPDDREWIILAGTPAAGGPTKVYALRQGVEAREVTVPATDAMVVDAAELEDCSFVQCFNKLIWMRGPSYAALELATVTAGFIGITQAANDITGAGTHNPTDGTEAIPQAVSALFFQNRLLVVHARDLVAASDYLNYTRYLPVRADFRINQGSADALLTLYPFGTKSIVALKEQSVLLVENIYGDLSDLTITELTREFGLAARKAVCGTGTDVWFLSQKGITSIGLIQDNKTQLQDARWSDAIPNTMARINWQYIEKATAVFHDGLILFAVPLDSAEMTTGGVDYTGVNTGVIVYDTANRAWAGTHEAENLMVRDWIHFTYLGKRRLGYLSEDGLVYLYDYDFDDHVRAHENNPTVVPIATRLVTRGYTGMDESRQESRPSLAREMKRWTAVAVVLNTWAPEFSIGAKTDGVSEETTLVEGQTRDRRKWHKPFDRADYDVSNESGEHADPYREDYSVDMRMASAGAGLEYGPILLGDEGVNFDQMQEAPVRYRCNREGRYCQVVIENVEGRCGVKSVSVEGRVGRRRNGVAA